MEKIQPENSRKFRENSKNGRAPRAKRAAHAHFWRFSGFFGIFRIFFSIQYCILLSSATHNEGLEIETLTKRLKQRATPRFRCASCCRRRLLAEHHCSSLRLKLCEFTRGGQRCFFQKIGQNGRPGGREPPRSTSFHETSRMVSVWGRRRKIIFL